MPRNTTDRQPNPIVIYVIYPLIVLGVAGVAGAVLFNSKSVIEFVGAIENISVSMEKSEQRIAKSEEREAKTEERRRKFEERTEQRMVVMQGSLAQTAKSSAETVRMLSDKMQNVDLAIASEINLHVLADEQFQNEITAEVAGLKKEVGILKERMEP